MPPSDPVSLISVPPRKAPANSPGQVARRGDDAARDGGGSFADHVAPPKRDAAASGAGQKGSETPAATTAPEAESATAEVTPRAETAVAAAVPVEVPDGRKAGQARQAADIVGASPTVAFGKPAAEDDTDPAAPRGAASGPDDAAAPVAPLVEPPRAEQAVDPARMPRADASGQTASAPESPPLSGRPGPAAVTSDGEGPRAAEAGKGADTALLPPETRTARNADAPAASPSVDAFRARTAAAPQAQAVIASDAAPSLSELSTLGLSSGRGAEWRLEAISGGSSAGAGAEARAALSAQPQAVAGQITVAIARTRERSVEIRLDPPELGRVQITLDPSEDGLRAVVLAERPETQDFLRRHADTLLRDLRESGYDSVALDFGSAGEQSQDARTPEDRRLAHLSPDAPHPATPEPGPSQPGGTPVADAGLDIRL